MSVSRAGIFTADGIDTRMLYKEFITGVSMYNEVEWGLLSKFVRPTTKETVKVWQRSMEMVEEAEGYKASWQSVVPVDIDIGLRDYALGYAFTKRALQDQTANELKEVQSEALRADQRLLAKLFFEAVLTPGVSGASVGFWDAFETRAPAAWKNNSFLTSHSHYGTTGAATVALADLNALKLNIRQHGYAGPLFLFINSAQARDIENLGGWTSALTENTIIETIATLGLAAVKNMQGLSIVIDDWVPSGYLLALEGTVKPIQMREPLNASARGLKLFEGPHEAYPLLEAYYERRAGMAVGHRGAGAVLQITTDASYTAPTFSYAL